MTWSKFRVNLDSARAYVMFWTGNIIDSLINLVRFLFIGSRAVSQLFGRTAMATRSGDRKFGCTTNVWTFHWIAILCGVQDLYLTCDAFNCSTASFVTLHYGLVTRILSVMVTRTLSWVQVKEKNLSDCTLTSKTLSKTDYCCFSSTLSQRCSCVASWSHVELARDPSYGLFVFHGRSADAKSEKIRKSTAHTGKYGSEVTIGFGFPSDLMRLITKEPTEEWFTQYTRNATIY